MEIEKFLELATEKLGSKMAENLVTQANMITLQSILVDKGICTKEEMDTRTEKILDGIHKNLDKLKEST